jgi:hypothetical protein
VSLALQGRFGSLFYRSGYEGADAFSKFFSRPCYGIMSGSVQVASNSVWEPFAWPSTLTPVSLVRHGEILAVLAGYYDNFNTTCTMPVHGVRMRSADFKEIVPLATLVAVASST